jgi:hypothetical protein
VSVFSTADGRENPVKSKKKLTLMHSAIIDCGSGFQPRFPGYRGRRPLPPTINFYPYNLEFYVVSYERRRWPHASSQIEKETLVWCCRRVGHRADQYRRAPWPPQLFQLCVVSYERRRWPEQRPVSSRKKLKNIEHRTFNIEHRIMYSVYFIKNDRAKRHPPFDNRQSSFVIPWSFIRTPPLAASVQSNRKRNWTNYDFIFSDKISQASQKNFAPAGWLDRISQNCSKKIL